MTEKKEKVVLPLLFLFIFLIAFVSALFLATFYYISFNPTTTITVYPSESVCINELQRFGWILNCTEYYIYYQAFCQSPSFNEINESCIEKIEDYSKSGGHVWVWIKDDCINNTETVFNRNIAKRCELVKA